MNTNSFRKDMLARELAIKNIHEKDFKKIKGTKKVLKTIKTEIRLIKQEITKIEAKKKLFK